MSTNDDVVVRLRLRDIARFIADVRAGRLEIEDLERRIRRVGSTSRAEASEYGGLGLWGATVGRVKYAVAGLALTLGAGAGAIAKYAITSAGTMQKLEIGFERMLGSKSAATQFIGQLQEFAKVAPYSFQDITTLTQKMLAFGAPAGQVLQNMQAIVDATASWGGSAADMDGVITALGQISMVGHVAGAEILQLNNHMINAKKYLMDALHVNEGQLTSMLEKKQISSSVGIPIILAGMERENAGAAAALAKTMPGLANNIVDAFQKEMVKATNPFIPTMTHWLQDMLDHAPQIAQSIGNIIGGAISLADKAGKFAVSVGAKIGSGDTVAAGREAGGVVPKAVGALMGGDSYDTGVDWGRKSIGFVLGFLEGMLDLGSWWGVIKKHWWSILLTFVSFIPGLGGVLGKAGEFLGRIPILRIFAPLLSKWGKISEWLSKPFDKLGRAIWRSLGRVYPEAQVSIWYFFARIGEFFEGTPGMVKGWALRFGRRILDTVVKGVGIVGGAIVGFMRAAGGGFMAAIGGAIAVTAGSVWSPLKDAFVSVINWIIDRWNWLADKLSLDTGLPGTPKISLPHFGHIGGMAAGGTVTSSGLSWVGERGPELRWMPKGASVIPLPKLPDVGESKARGLDSRPIYLVATEGGKPLAQLVNAGNDSATARL